MKLIELRIDEDSSRKLELSEIVEFFPNTYARVMKAKVGTDQLTFGGKALFQDDGGDGPAMDAAREQIDDLIEQNGGIEINITVDVSEIESFPGEMEMNFTAKIDGKQAVFLGYHPKSNQLYIGYDMWLGEEEFNEEWDRAFMQATGEHFDNDEPAHEHAFKKAWSQFKEMMFFGGLYSVSAHYTQEDQLEVPGGFFRGVAKTTIFRNLELINFIG